MDAVIWERIQRTSECWVWTGSHNRDGYGQLTVQRVTRGAHRLVYEELVGAVPDGMELDHLCVNRDCVNPQHLEIVTHAENMRRSAQRGHYPNQHKTVCEHGHSLVDRENVYIRPNGNRTCRTCQRETMRRRRAT